MDTYESVIEELRRAYDGAAAERRDGTPKAGWKRRERRRFLDLLRRERRTSLLEVGAGTGDDALFFQERGLRVVCTDLSPAMVERCRAKGLDARVADFLALDLPPACFDALWALNCLLHVPDADLGRVLARLRDVLRPGGLAWIGVYGADRDEELRVPDPGYPVPRFFSRRTDATMRAAVAEWFEVVWFDAVPLEGESFHFQSTALRRPG